MLIIMSSGDRQFEWPPFPLSSHPFRSEESWIGISGGIKATLDGLHFWSIVLVLQ